MQNPYELLGLTPDATESELREAYTRLRDKYKEERFLPGEEGNNAAIKLNELEDAWKEISEALSRRNFSSDYDYIARLIKEKNYDEAQRQLDGISERNAKWHFYQSQVYYYREWLVECRKQLSIAIDLDPDNAQYKTAMEKLNTIMGNSKADPHSFSDGDDIDAARANANRARQEEMAGAGNALSNCCTAYCLTSLCCDCMQCCCR